jgi:hypothetical protein
MEGPKRSTPAAQEGLRMEFDGQAWSAAIQRTDRFEDSDRLGWP